MEKKIRWQIPFLSIDNVEYRIDIYGEGDFEFPIQLLAGPSPITIEEDNDSDIFSPIRIQTGTIEVCSLTGDDVMMTLDDILPKSNTDCPVQLVRVDTDHVEWNGFLSCECYTQHYVSTPQILSLPIISVLEAMNSVECKLTEFNGAKSVCNIIGYVLSKIQEIHGASFNNIYISGIGVDILPKYVNTSLFYSIQSLVIDGYKEEYAVGDSLKKVLEKLATFMGWCVREQGSDFYFQAPDGDYRMLQTSISELQEYQPAFLTFVPIVTSNIVDLAWMGTQHSKSTYQGARNVKVTADIQDFDIKVSIPEGIPDGDVITAARTIPIPNWNVDEEPYQATAYLSLILKFSSRYDFQIFHIEDYDQSPFFELILTNRVGELYSHSRLDLLGNEINTDVGAAMVRIISKPAGYDTTGIYVIGTSLVAIKDSLTLSQYIFKSRGINYFNAYNGSLVVDFNAMYPLGGYFENGYSIPVAIKWGELFLQPDMQTWSSTFAYVSLTKNDEPTYIKIEQYHAGEVVFYLMPLTASTNIGDHIYEYILTSLSITYEPPLNVVKESGSNSYFKKLDTSFKADKSITTDLASSFYNSPNLSLVLNNDPESSYSPLQTMMFYQMVKYEDRPEKSLLNRLKMYYELSRSVLKLEVKTPITPLPLLKMIGYKDKKFYTPLAIKRDYRTDTAVLSCVEINPWLIIRTNQNKLWEDHFDYISLTSTDPVSYLYLTSPIDVKWIDRNDTLQPIDINNSTGSGIISAGENVIVTFHLDDDSLGDTIDGVIDLYQNDQLVYSIEVIAR